MNVNAIVSRKVKDGSAMVDQVSSAGEPKDMNLGHKPEKKCRGPSFQDEHENPK